MDRQDCLSSTRFVVRSWAAVTKREHEQLRRSWVANAEVWRDAVREQRIESRRLVTDRAIVDTVLERKPSRVLDLGCGEGWLARALASHGIEVTGVDASAPLIEAARAAGGPRFLVASYEELVADPSLPGSRFDLVVANFSLLDDGAEELLAALTAIARACIVQTVHPAFTGGDYADGWRTETFDGMAGEWREAMPWYFRTLGSWIRMFRRADYTVIDIREPLNPNGVPASIVFIAERS